MKTIIENRTIEYKGRYNKTILLIHQSSQPIMFIDSGISYSGARCDTKLLQERVPRRLVGRRIRSHEPVTREAICMCISLSINTSGVRVRCCVSNQGCMHMYVFIANNFLWLSCDIARKRRVFRNCDHGRSIRAIGEGLDVTERIVQWHFVQSIV